MPILMLSRVCLRLYFILCVLFHVRRYETRLGVSFAFLLDPRISQESLRPVLGLDSPCPVSSQCICTRDCCIFVVYS